MYNITLFRDVLQPQNMLQKKYTFEQIYLFLTHARKPVPKKKQVAWVPATFTAGTKRANANCKEVSLMVIDIDGMFGYTYVQDRLLHMRLQHMLHTSFSHSPKCDKFRVVLPLMTPVPAAEWKHWHRGMCTWWDENIHIPSNVKIHGQLDDYRLPMLDKQELDRRAHDSCRAYYAGYKTQYFKSHLYMDGGFVDFASYAERAKLQEEIRLEKKKLEAEQARLRLEAHKKHLDGKRSSYSDQRKYYYEMLKTQADWRRALAVKLGAGIVHSPSGDRAVKWMCPQCQRNDATYFYINPITNISTAKCGHVNSCNWSNSLGYLAEVTGNLGG